MVALPGATGAMVTVESDTLAVATEAALDNAEYLNVSRSRVGEATRHVNLTRISVLVDRAAGNVANRFRRLVHVGNSHCEVLRRGADAIAVPAGKRPP